MYESSVTDTYICMHKKYFFADMTKNFSYIYVYKCMCTNNFLYAVLMKTIYTFFAKIFQCVLLMK